MSAVEAVGWALVHFVWQGAAVAGALAVALRAVPRTHAPLRYALSAAALAAMLALPMATVGRLANDPRGWTRSWTLRSQEPVGHDRTRADSQRMPLNTSVDAGTAPREDEAATGVASSAGLEIVRFAAVRSWIQPAIPLLVWMWLAGVLVLAARVIGGWWRTRTFRTTDIRAAADVYRAVVPRLATALGVRRAVNLLESARIDAPIVIGWWRPVILLPAAALSGLKPSQIEAIIAHELAHVRRHDWLANLAQTVVETLLFYHPAVWWVSRQMRIEREHCCDDLAVTTCGDPRAYVEALIDLEHLRRPALSLALGMTSGSLVSRARRLLIPPAHHSHSSPALGAAAVAVAAAVIIGVNAAAPDAGASEPPSQPQSPTLIQAPVPDAPLSERWRWADEQARARRAREYWIGYLIEPPETFRHLLFLDRGNFVVSQDGSTFLSGKLFSTEFKGLQFRGAPLAAAAELGEARDVKLLFSFTQTGGSPRLARVHVSSRDIPVALDAHPVFWLGRADTAQSLTLVDPLYRTASTTMLREALIGAIGIHGPSDRTVPLLVRYLTSDEPNEVRGEAAEWLAWHPTAAALAALERAARSDRSIDVRREAAEALGDMEYQPASAALIELSRSLDHRDVRLEAVEALGARKEVEARDALVAIVREDSDLDIQREAVETLGDLNDPEALRSVAELARAHSDPDVRREAIETLAEHADPATAVATLKDVLNKDPDRDVRDEVIDTLGSIEHADAAALLRELARRHDDPDVRREAVQALAETDSPQQAATDLREILNRDSSPDVQEEALESLMELPDGIGVPAVIDAARAHPDNRLRRKALKLLVESDDPRARALIERALAKP